MWIFFSQFHDRPSKDCLVFRGLAMTFILGNFAGILVKNTGSMIHRLFLFGMLVSLALHSNDMQ